MGLNKKSLPEGRQNRGEFAEKRRDAVAETWLDTAFTRLGKSAQA